VTTESAFRELAKAIQPLTPELVPWVNVGDNVFVVTMIYNIETPIRCNCFGVYTSLDVAFDAIREYQHENDRSVDVDEPMSIEWVDEGVFRVPAPGNGPTYQIERIPLEATTE
jgi:hypothetical protein